MRRLVQSRQEVPADEAEFLEKAERNLSSQPDRAFGSTPASTAQYAARYRTGVELKHQMLLSMKR